MLELAIAFLVFGLLSGVMILVNFVLGPRNCFCGFCVEACPVDAIRMDTGEIRLATSSRSALEARLDKP